MFGTRDTSVPTEQGWEHFRAMQQAGAALVRFILFPGAGHGPVTEAFDESSPTDKRCEYTPPPPGYTGFRVLEEK